MGSGNKEHDSVVVDLDDLVQWDEDTEVEGNWCSRAYRAKYAGISLRELKEIEDAQSEEQSTGKAVWPDRKR